MELVEEGPYRFRIPQRGEMRVPGIVYASRALIPDLAADRCLEQVANVAPCRDRDGVGRRQRRHLG